MNLWLAWLIGSLVLIGGVGVGIYEAESGSSGGSRAVSSSGSSTGSSSCITVTASAPLSGWDSTGGAGTFCGNDADAWCKSHALAQWQASVRSGDCLEALGLSPADRDPAKCFTDLTSHGKYGGREETLCGDRARQACERSNLSLAPDAIRAACANLGIRVPPRPSDNSSGGGTTGGGSPGGGATGGGTTGGGGATGDGSTGGGTAGSGTSGGTTGGGPGGGGTPGGDTTGGGSTGGTTGGDTTGGGTTGGGTTGGGTTGGP